MRYFLAAARELNFTRAAAECDVSQPSLTRAIRLLEAELGGALFRRERNLTHLTDLGRHMLPLLAQCVENADRANRLAEAARSAGVASLRVAIVQGAPLEPFVPHLRELAGVFDGCDIRIDRGAAADLHAALKEGAVDVLLGPRPDPAWERFECRPLFRCGYGIVARRDHPIATKAVLAAEDLRDGSLLHRPDCAAAAGLRAHVERVGVTLRPAPAFATDDDLIRYLIATGSIAFLPTHSSLCERLVRRRFDGPDFGYDLHVTTVSGRLRGPALGLFLNQLRAAAWSAEAT